MFCLDPSPSWPAQVTVTTNGGPKATLDVCYRHRGRSEMAAFVLGIKDRPLVDVLLDAVQDWQAANAAGEAVPWSREAAQSLIEHHAEIPGEILEAYVRLWPEYRAGN